MRATMVVFWVFLCCHCAPVPEAVVPPRVSGPRFDKPSAVLALPSAPETPLEPLRATRELGSEIVFEGVAFDSRSHRLLVADQPGGPASRFADAMAAARSNRGLAAVNAGFFTPTGEPLGLVVAGGKRRGAWNGSSALGAGVWHEDSVGRSAIRRREAIGKSAASGMRELIQAGPLLVENGRSVSGLESSKRSVRTVILWDGTSRWWLGQASACSLFELGAALAGSQPAGWPVRHALNLDGGRSSDLWISSAVEGGPLVRRALWNRPVRNFLILVAR